MKNKIIIMMALTLIGIIHYEFIPKEMIQRDTILDQIKEEYKTDCYYGETHTYKYYNCDDLKKFIEKREQQLKGESK